jgi:hypothetical protein
MRCLQVLNHIQTWMETADNTGLKRLFRPVTPEVASSILVAPAEYQKGISRTGESLFFTALSF